MTLILNSDGRVINKVEKEIDEIKRESYRHSSQEVLKEEEEKEELASFVDSLEELGEEGDDIPEADLDPNAVEIAMQFADFKVNFIQAFGEEELTEAFAQFEDFFSSKGVDTTLDMSGMVAGEEGIPGMESSEQSIVTSEVEEF